MRSLVVLAVLMSVARADQQADDDKLVLDAARTAGFANPTIVARGDIVIVDDRGESTDNVPLGIVDSRAIAVGPHGTPIVELAKLGGPLGAVAAKPFLGSKTLVQIDVRYAADAHSPDGYTKTRRFVVRTGTLEKACEFDLSYDTGSAFKGSRTTDKVTVTKLKAKPLTFTVKSMFDRQTYGGPRDRKTTTTKFELGETGVCVDLTKQPKK